MHAPVYIGVMALIVISDAFNNTTGFLSGGGVVQVHEPLTVNLSLQDGKILFNPMRVKLLGGFYLTFDFKLPALLNV